MRILQAVLLGAVLWCEPMAMAFQLAEADPAVAIIPRERPRPAPMEPEPLLRIDSSLVLVPVHVTNAIGASVTGLERQTFRILEDQVEQTVSSFGMEDGPVSIAFLFDTSGSMRNKMKKSAEAAAAFFRTANSEDEFLLIEFNDKAKVTVPFTGNSDEVYQQIVHTRPAGRTTLMDAVYMALAQMKQARHTRKAIVVLSDGGDNWSRHSAREVKSALLEADVQVYAMGIFDDDMRTAEERNGPKLLDDITELTGGRHYRVDDLDQLPVISERIGRELRTQYLLGYYSTNDSRDGKYRQVSVRLAAPNVRGLRANYRRGYYAPLD